jgi:nitrite reductase/ring-hydroxylating ferredoxin subunit
MWFSVCKKNELKSGDFKSVSLLGKKIGVFNRDGEIYAISVKCRHQGADLTKGKRNGDLFICPRHFWNFDLYTGKCTKPTGILPLPKYALRVVDGMIEVNPSEII